MPPHGGHGHGGGHHGGHHGGGGYPSFGPGWGGGGSYWEPQRTELVVVSDDTREKERIAKYLASLPEKERAAAFAKIYGSAPMSGLGLDVAGISLGSFALGALAGWIAAGFVVRNVVKKHFVVRRKPSRR